MTSAESFALAMRVAEAELIAETTETLGYPSGTIQGIVQNILRFPDLLARLRRHPFRCDDVLIAKIMVDPATFTSWFINQMDPDTQSDETDPNA